MNAHLKGTIVAGVIIAMSGCGTSDSHSAPPAKPATPATTQAPMPQRGFELSLAANYGFMAQEFAIGDAKTYGTNYTPSATLWSPNYGTMQGRAEIVAKFGSEGRRLGVRDFTRTSMGYRVEPETRDVVDSGSYKIVSVGPLLPKTLEPKGRYRTRWHIGDDGQWLIVTDSIYFASKSP